MAKETGKSLKDARGETGAAIEMGMFVAGEGRRFYGRTTTSAIPNKTAQTVRQPLGVAGLIIAANTPIANVAWKVVSRAALRERRGAQAGGGHTAQRMGLRPAGAGGRAPAGRAQRGARARRGGRRALVESPEVDLISFTGSTAVGRWIAQAAGARLAKVCLELGGKNPLIVCDDADLDRAAEAAVLSAFSNAGQRCAAGSRIIVFDVGLRGVPRAAAARGWRSSRVGCGDEDDFGPVINEAQLSAMCAAIEAARREGVTVLTGGAPALRPGIRRRVLPGAHAAGERRPGVGDLPGGAVRADLRALPGTGLRGRARPRQRLTLRAHGLHPHGERPPRDDLRVPDSLRRGGRQRRHLRERAAPARSAG